MKVNFLKQIARMLVFSLFVAGFPVNMQAASPAPSSSSSCPGCTDVFTATLGAPLAKDVKPTDAQVSQVQSTAAPKGCKGFTTSTCNLNSCMTNASPNSPTTFDLSKMTALIGTDYTNSPNAIANYSNTAKYLAAALGGYISAINNHTQLTTFYVALQNLVINYLYINPYPNSAQNPSGYTQGVLPFTTTNLNVSSNIFPNGDFAPLGKLTPAQMGQLMLGYIQYEYNFMPTAGNKSWILQNVVALILYSTLAKQMNLFAYYGWAWAAFAGQANDVNGVGQETPANPTPQQALDFINNSTFIDQYVNGPLKGKYKPGSPYQFINGTISDQNVLNLLSKISNAQWSSFTSVDYTTLYNVMTGLDLSAVTSTFSTENMSDESATDLAWVPFMLSMMQALATNNLYLNCSVDLGTGQGLDNGIYYGLNTSQASAKLSDAYAALQATMASQATGGASSTPVSTALPAKLNDFVVNYMKGSFYQFLPSSVKATPATPAVSAKPATAFVPATATTPAIPAKPATPAIPASSGNDASDGPLHLSGLSNGVSDMMPGSIWATVCANSGSSKLASEQATILNQIQLATALESPIGVVDGSGAPTMPGNTLQGAAQNVITAAQAAIAQPPLSAYATSKYAWVNASYPPQQDTSSALSGANITVTPTVLAGFNTSFATKDNMNMLADIIAIMSNYSVCWNNLSYCANPPGTVGGNATSVSSCALKIANVPNYFTKTACAMDIAEMPYTLLKNIGQQFNSPLGAAMMLLMGKQTIDWIKSKVAAGEAANQKIQSDLVNKMKSMSTTSVQDLPDGGYPLESSWVKTSIVDSPKIQPYDPNNPSVPESGDGLPSGPGTNTSGTGTGSGNQLPVDSKTFASEEAAVAQEVQNIGTLSDSSLDQLAEQVEEEEQTAEADEAAGTADAVTEVETAKENADEVKERAEEDGDATAEEDVDAI